MLHKTLCGASTSILPGQARRRCAPEFLLALSFFPPEQQSLLQWNNQHVVASHTPECSCTAVDRHPNLDWANQALAWPAGQLQLPLESNIHAMSSRPKKATSIDNNKDLTGFHVGLKCSIMIFFNRSCHRGHPEENSLHHTSNISQQAAVNASKGITKICVEWTSQDVFYIIVQICPLFQSLSRQAH